ncbi:hypothetical protein PsorP6_017437 [Peronosclerospora sorghi]|uniref:Uncharacterized protein n=1 Tax=Peronosclerospora sorghi TaxID=230839 RepID=A0ACC0WP14_9STRA|nr:hypothetical protein PsorP6_017437 [Peronosclerospora sorghi]
MDIDKRRRAIREKKLKLQNPMFFVSPVRLFVRNLSTSLDERELKKLFHDTASTGMRAGNVDLSKMKPELLIKAPNPPIKVQMAKLLRDMESAKADQKPRSRGSSSVQFTEHLHALAALRELNNNPKYTMYADGRNAASKSWQQQGLQGDRQEDPETPSEQKAEDTGLEMQNDFEGTMHDMPGDEEGEQNESEDREELDREMGDFDQNDENVVDGKLWGEVLTAMRIELTRKRKSLRKSSR